MELNGKTLLVSNLEIGTNSYSKVRLFLHPEFAKYKQGLPD